MLRMRLCFGAVISAALLSVNPASAATVSSFGFDGFSRSQLGTAQKAMSGFLSEHTVTNLHVETFEEYKAWDGSSGTTNPQNTKVGSFSSFGPAGNGLSKIGDGSKLQVRGDNAMPWGRYNTDEMAPQLGGQWLDSNDNLGMQWQISGLGAFNAIAFFVSDIADVGGIFSIKVGDTLFSDLAMGKKLANGNIHLVKILLSEAVSSLTVELMHDRTNDGFGIDGAAIARIAPAPLPPAAALLFSGLAALVALGRRRKAATAA